MMDPRLNDPADDTLPFRVETTEVLGPDVMRLFLSPARERRLRYRAGQYVQVAAPGGVRRSLSIANAPGPHEVLELHVRRVHGGAFSDFVFNRLQPGALLSVSGPYGGFFLREGSQRPVILLAGGTGFAPIKGIVEQALATDIDRPMHLYWGARTRHDLYLHELARSWSDAPDFHYIPVLSDDAHDPPWPGRHGLVHEAVLGDFPALDGYEVYANGPPGMIATARRALLAKGLPEKFFYSDVD